MESSYAPGKGGGGGGTLNFSCYVDLDKAFPHSKKKYQKYQTYPKQLKVSNPKKICQFCI